MLTRRAFVLGGSGALLAACSTVPVSRAEAPRIRFAHLPKLTFDVGGVFIDDSTGDQTRDRAPLPPAVMARDWARDRLASVSGQSGSLRYTIREAWTYTRTIREKDPFFDHRYGRKKNRHGLTSDFFHTRQKTAIRGDIHVTLTVTTPDRGTGHIEVQVWRSREVDDLLTLAGEDAELLALVSALSVDLNAELERKIGAQLAGFVV